jgi:hypothetical protein
VSGLPAHWLSARAANIALLCVRSADKLQMGEISMVSFCPYKPSLFPLYLEG